MCGKGAVRETEIVTFWRENPTPVIYLRNHTLTILPEKKFFSMSTRTGGLVEMPHYLLER